MREDSVRALQARHCFIKLLALQVYHRDISESHPNTVEIRQPFIDSQAFLLELERFIDLALISQDTGDVSQRHRTLSCIPQLLVDGYLLPMELERFVDLALLNEGACMGNEESSMATCI